MGSWGQGAALLASRSEAKLLTAARAGDASFLGAVSIDLVAIRAGVDELLGHLVHGVYVARLSGGIRGLPDVNECGGTASSRRDRREQASRSHIDVPAPNKGAVSTSANAA